MHRLTSLQGSSCNSVSAKTARLGNKLSGKAPKSRQKSQQSNTPVATAGTAGSQTQAQTQTQAQAQVHSHTSLTGLAEPVSSVSAFCQAVLSKIIPHEFWGVGHVQEHNRVNFLRNIDRFIKLRRFETISLHDVMQGFRVRI